MIKPYIKIFYVCILFMMLSSCKLVIEDTTLTTETTTQIKPINIIGFSVEEFDKDTLNYREPEYFLYKNDIPNIPSPFFGSVRIGTISKNDLREETAEVDYYVDLNRPDTSYLLSQIYVEDGEIKKGESLFGSSNGISFSLRLSTINGHITSTHQVNFIDIDYLTEYKVIQFDVNNQKIKEDVLTLDDESNEFQLSDETNDFLIIESYLTFDQNPYEKKKLISVSELQKNPNQTHYENVVALDEAGNRYRTSVIFKLGVPTNE